MSGPLHDPEFEALLDYLKHSRGFDFTGYKRPSLMRRIQKQMQAGGIKSYANYCDYLEVHAGEFAHLFNTILINVTTFFRDASSWDYLSEEIIPRILASKSDTEPIRLWSAGCAAGQEPYSLAMALAEKMGIKAFRERVKIYATDMDEEALTQARSAAYTQHEVHGIPPDLQEKYFEREASLYVFHKELRRSVIFGRHDLLRDAPISRIDLLTCRNTVMYFNAEVQAQIVARFHFAVADGGFLFLGKAEMLSSHAELFMPLDLKRRIFVKIAKPSLHDRQRLLAQAGGAPLEMPLDNYLRLRDAVFQTGAVAQIVVDPNGMLAMANEGVRALFQLTERDLGRPLQDLELSYRPVELRSCIEQAYAERRAVSVQEAPYVLIGGETVFLNALIVPLQEGSLLLGVSISFTDATRSRQLSEELQEAGRALETTNEELQSTNEELEATNEELQSTNEEIQTINGDMRLRAGELNRANAFLKSILTSLRSAVVVLDQDLFVQIWNSKSQDLWGLRPEEAVGKSFLTLDIGLPVEELIIAIRACLTDRNGHQELMVEARNRRGKKIRCSVMLTPMLDHAGDVQGIALVIEILVNEDQPTTPAEGA